MRFPQPAPPADGFTHEALIYHGDDDLVSKIVPFITEGQGNGEAVLVALPAARLDLIRRQVDASAGAGIDFVDMAAAGGNPATILALWQQFAASGRPIRGVGEPVWAGRSAAQLDECHHHEAVLNRVFAEGPAWRLVCPYNAQELAAEVIDRAWATHPVVDEGDGPVRHARYFEDGGGVLNRPLPEPPRSAMHLSFDGVALRTLRSLITGEAIAAGVAEERIGDLTLAVTELITNSERHAPGYGTLALWADGSSFICQVADDGRIDDPLAGRRPPDHEHLGGRGLWLANQLSDLFQVRSGNFGTVVRLHFTR